MTKKIIQKHFKRIETKYILNNMALADVMADLNRHMLADEFAQSTITNIYFDNSDFQMVQDSLDKKHGKEKIRMRLYDAHPTSSSQAFLEIKKKLDGVGVKYRLTSNPVSVIKYIRTGLADSTIVDDKVTAELTKLRQRYGAIRPMMYISYDRLSLKGRQDSQVRVTIDRNLLYRAEQVSDLAGAYGESLLPKDQVIVEIKVVDEIPDWLAMILTKHQLEKVSFSKYGNAYKLHQAKCHKEATYAQSII